jgi:hypothetical protein
MKASIPSPRHAPGRGPGSLKNLDSRQEHAGMTIGVERPWFLRSYKNPLCVLCGEVMKYFNLNGYKGSQPIAGAGAKQFGFRRSNVDRHAGHGIIRQALLQPLPRQVRHETGTYQVVGGAGFNRQIAKLL